MIWLEGNKKRTLQYVREEKMPLERFGKGGSIPPSRDRETFHGLRLLNFIRNC